MGILKSHIHIMAMENKPHPIKGKVLVLSQQAVFATLDQVKSILSSYGVKLGSIPANFDTKNKMQEWVGTKRDSYTNCKSVMKLLGADEVHVCDISLFEGADFIMDLNAPIEKKYIGQYDAVVAFGTLEHIFDVPQALENMNLLLRPNGVLVNMSPASNYVNHGFYSISPTLYVDYFRANGFDNFSIYLTKCNGSDATSPRKAYRLPTSLLTSDLSHFSGLGEAIFFTKKPQNYVFKNRRDIIQSRYAQDQHWAGKGLNVNSFDNLKKNYKSLPFQSYLPYDIASIAYSSLKKHFLPKLEYVGKF